MHASFGHAVAHVLWPYTSAIIRQVYIYIYIYVCMYGVRARARIEKCASRLLKPRRRGRLFFILFRPPEEKNRPRRSSSRARDILPVDRIHGTGARRCVDDAAGRFMRVVLYTYVLKKKNQNLFPFKIVLCTVGGRAESLLIYCTRLGSSRTYII